MTSILLRAGLWLLLYTLLLGAPDIHVTYRDGLEINLHGWASKLFKRRRS